MKWLERLNGRIDSKLNPSPKKRKVIMPLTLIISILLVTVLAKYGIINNYLQTIIVTICINIIMSASLIL